MEENQKKDVGKALTTDEIRHRAHKWNLAGDVGLLAHLDQFSQNLIKKSQGTQNNLNALCDACEDASTSTNNVINQFLALQNSQFVENRVYDDESPSEEQKVDEKICKEDQEKLLLDQYKKAVEIGIKLLDSHFEEVQLPPNSDSDEEEVGGENPGLVWKPKNLYAGKKFPLLIGSAEWWADDNVGLGEYEENINPDSPFSESESEIEAEEPDKRIRMSSSSSTESEKVSSKRSKEENIDGDDIFAPKGKDPFNAQNNLFSKEDGKISKPPTLYGISESINPLDLPGAVENEEGDLNNSYSSKPYKSYLFDDNEDGNSVDEGGTEVPPPEANQNRFSNAFTKELTSKLSSVASKNGNDSKIKFDVKSNDKEQSALFDENDDNDDLFSAKNPVLLKKQSLFSDGDADDQLFGDSDNLFSGSSARQTRNNVKNSSRPEPNGSLAKENNSSILFDKPGKFPEDDLFGNNDNLLFSGKSGLNSNSGAGDGNWKNSREVKFSTPTEQRSNREVPGSDVFGGVSEISNGSSNLESVSAISNDIDNSFNFSRLSSTDVSKDYGFVEPSEVSNIKGENSGLFEPRLTSTRDMPSDTSDYKTNLTDSDATANGTKSDSSKSRPSPNGRMGHSENPHFSLRQSENSKGLFDGDDDDDLFNTGKSSKSNKESSLFDDFESDGLFDVVTPKANRSRPAEAARAEGGGGHQKPSATPFEDEEEEKFSLADKLKQDSVSMSSSRSSLFDDANLGKTNLASVFDNDKSSKNSTDLFGKSDDDLFGDKAKNLGDYASDDLFGGGGGGGGGGPLGQGKIKTSKSLFDDLEDVDDLFGDEASKKLFEGHDEDADLFGKPQKDDLTIGKSAGSERKKEGKVVMAEEASPGINIEPDKTAGKNLSNSLGKATDEIGPNERLGGNEKKKVSETKSKEGSLFGEFEDEDEDLFSNKKKEETKGTQVRNQGRELLDNFLEEEDDIFNVGTPKLKTGEPVSEPLEVGSKTSAGLFDDLPGEKSGRTEKTKTILGDDENSKEKLDVNTKVNKDLFDKNEDLFDDRTSKSVTENKFNDNLFSSKPVDEKKPLNDKAKEGIRPSPPNSLTIVKNRDATGKQDNNQSETDGLAATTEKKVIGKLNIPAGLKINPMSLLPGASMKKPAPAEEVAKKDEADEPDRIPDNPPEPVESSPNLLKCLSKDRVKIQTRRRPQTRRARHEALRSSGIDFRVDPLEVPSSMASRSRSVDDFEKGFALPSSIKSSSDTNVSDSVLVNSVDEPDKIMENADSSNSIFHSVENSPEALFSSPLASNALSPSTDEEDYFNVPELDINFEREDHSIFKTNINDFKKDDNADDTLLFDSAPVLSPMNPGVGLMARGEKEKKPEERKRDLTGNVTRQKIMKSKIIIDDEDDEDSLFKSTESKRTGSVLEKKPEVKSRTSNIFDDFDDGDSFLFQKKPVGIIGGKEVPKKTLFDDNDEDDDLFGDKSSPGTSLSKTGNDSASVIKLNNNNKSVSEKSKEPFVDPLGLMTNLD